jgi:type I restriction enzyme S subunit
MKAEGKYKKTDVGVIPEDWEVVDFQEVMDGFSSGQTPYRGKPEFYKGTIPWITSGELNYKEITDTKEKITPEGVRDANLKIIPKGTFLFAITGLEAEGTRGSCAITGIEATTNQSCMALYPKKGLLTTLYLYHFSLVSGYKSNIFNCLEIVLSNFWYSRWLNN